MTKKEVKQLLLDIQFELLDAADHFQKLFYKTHGVITPGECYAKEQSYRHAADIVSKKINQLKRKAN